MADSFVPRPTEDEEVVVQQGEVVRDQRQDIPPFEVTSVLQTVTPLSHVPDLSAFSATPAGGIVPESAIQNLLALLISSTSAPVVSTSTPEIEDVPSAEATGTNGNQLGEGNEQTSTNPDALDPQNTQSASAEGFVDRKSVHVEPTESSVDQKLERAPTEVEGSAPQTTAHADSLAGTQISAVDFDAAAVLSSANLVVTNVEPIEDAPKPLATEPTPFTINHLSNPDVEDVIDLRIKQQPTPAQTSSESSTPQQLPHTSTELGITNIIASAQPLLDTIAQCGVLPTAPSSILSSDAPLFVIDNAGNKANITSHYMESEDSAEEGELSEDEDQASKVNEAAQAVVDELATPKVKSVEEQVGGASKSDDKAGGLATEVISSDDESSDSGSDFAFSDSEGEEKEKESDKPAPTPNKRKRAVEMDDMDEDGPAATAELRTKNELSALPPVEPINIEIPKELPLTLVGTIFGLVEETVIVQAVASGEVMVLDMDSILVFEDREVVGRIFDTFGPVTRPLYSIRFNTKEEIDAEKYKLGRDVYYIKDLAKFVFTQPLKKMKGSDASNIHDEEVGEDDMEFSDDEQEAEHKRQLKSKRKHKKSGVEDGDDGSRKRHAPDFAGYESAPEEGEEYEEGQVDTPPQQQAQPD
ncbi:hypothetical protein HK097_002501, partial [Rhizophlyctis rosea]